MARHADVVAPGRSITSLAVPGSWVDETYPAGRVGSAYFKGSGTSQATAVVSGAVALLLSEYPGLSPDQVKAVLTHSGVIINGTGRVGDVYDKGLLQLQLAKVPGPLAGMVKGKVVPQRSSSSPLLHQDDLSLEAARGSYHVSYVDANGVTHVLAGEVDVTGAAFDSHVWRSELWDSHLWRDEAWDGVAWLDGTWDGHVWRSRGWSAGDWQGSAWQGHIWRDDGLAIDRLIRGRKG